ncbi:MAG: hypothetical protein WBN81_17420, partial [Gammaproteobacteria bacterium]
DLGMHCADLDYKIFSILPPFNVVHAQVIRLGDKERLPKLMNDNQIKVVYSATSSPNDPAGANSINTTSKNLPSVFKTNFWNQSGKRVNLPGSDEKQTLGGRAYNPLYPSVLAAALLDPPVDLSFACIDPNIADPAASSGCPGILQVFESLPVDVGLPVPDLVDLAHGTLAVDQQKMPGKKNKRRAFKRFVNKQPFFSAFDFGQTIRGANWFAAEGIPILPVDNTGKINAYPLMKVAALDRSSGDTLGSLDVVLPVAAEANCLNCHADIDDAGNGSASNFASTGFDIVKAADAPGPEKLNNAAKLNILRLHDARHGMKYQQWSDTGSLVDAQCDTSSNPNSNNCLAKTRKVQCSRCHYSPALDLTQGGPVDEPALDKLGRQQTRHITMSRAMHAHHGNLPPFMGASLFPDMPPANDPLRTARQNSRPVNSYERGILEDSCYQCHPGSDTQCLRGAMFSGGVVCQDCHGNMVEVGNDFSMRVSHTNPGDFILDGSLRVPWASEPACQSCHTGDAMNPRHPAGAIIAPDRLRLLQAYTPATLDVPGVGSVQVAHMIQSPDSPFAEDQGVNANGDSVSTLYRLSTGHGGVKCEGCHNSTHAIWPVKNSFSNDNIAAKQLQGHTGTLIECKSCHGKNSFDIDDFKNNLTANGRMKGPHGMHPVNDPMWTEKHKEVDKDNNRNACRSCHGVDGEGPVLSRVAKKRVFECDETDRPGCSETANGKTITLGKGTQVSCTLCHDNYING